MEGIALAKKHGVYKGRKPLYGADQDVSALQERVQSGEKKAHIARDLGITRQTLYKYLGRR